MVSRAIIRRHSPLCINLDYAESVPYGDPNEEDQLRADPDGARARLGWVIFDSPGDQPVGRTVPLSEEFLDQLLPRTQQIFCCDAAAGFVVPFNQLTSSGIAM